MTPSDPRKASRALVLGVLLIGLTLSIVFATSSAASGAGSDPFSSSSCSVGFFGNKVNETSGSLVLQCSRVAWTQITSFPSGCSANQFVTVIAASITCSTVAWTGLTSFPAGCSAGQFVTGVGITLTCSSVAWSQITGFPSACPAGQFVTTIGSSLTCANPPLTSPGVTRETVTYPYTTLQNGKVSQDVTSFTLPANDNLSVYFASGNETGIAPGAPIGFLSSTLGARSNPCGPCGATTTGTIAITALAGATIVISAAGQQSCLTNCGGVQPSVTSVVDTLGSIYTSRSGGQTGNMGVGLFTSSKVIVGGADTITVTWTLGVGALSLGERIVVGQYSNVVSIGSSTAQTCGIGCTTSINLQPTGVLSNSVLVGSFTESPPYPANTYSVGAGQAIRQNILVTVGDCCKISLEDKNSTCVSLCTESFSDNFAAIGGGAVILYDVVELRPTSIASLQIVDTTASSQVVLYQLDVSISPFYQGGPNNAAILVSFKFVTDRIITFRVNGGGLTVTITGLVVISVA